MITRQPKWKCIAQLGDENPIDYGGYWVFIDTTGVYAPEAEILRTLDDDDSAEPYQAYRFVLASCVRGYGGIVSDNPLRPDLCAWFSKPEDMRADSPQDTTYLKNVADYCGTSVRKLAACLCSSDPLKLAEAYKAIGDYHGFRNLDQYPLTMTRTEARRRYRLARYRVKD